MFINFNVSNMKLTVKMPNNIVAHSQDYLKAHFNFLTDDWQGKDKVAYFSIGEPNEENLPFAVALDENGECTIPKEKISEPGYLYIGVGGTDLTVDLPTNYVKFKLTEGVDFTGDEGSTPTPSLIAQMWEVVNEAKEIAQNGGGTGTGADGFSPIATVEKVGNTATITITDKNGTTTAKVTDGIGGISDLILEDYSPVTKPILSVTGSCNFTSSLNITMSTDIPCDIYYTLDGNVPTISSTKYTTSFTITDSKRIKVFAVDSNGVSSDVITTSYLNNNDVTAPVITINPVSKSFSDTQEVEITLNETGVIQYTLDGSTPNYNSQRYNGKIKLTNTTTLKVMARDPLGNTSAVKTETYTKTTSDVTAPVLTITPSANFDTTQTVTISVNETATIYYTTDGSAPTVSSNIYSAPLSLSVTTTVKAFAKDIAGNSSAIQTVTYTKNATDTTAPVLTISPNGGNFTTSQAVTISTNETAIIYYTLDGSTPTTSSAVYSGAITLNSTTTLKAFAKDTNGNSSVVQTATYTKSTVSNNTPTAPVIALSGVELETTVTIALITASTDVEDGTITKYNVYKNGVLHASNATIMQGNGYQLTGLTVNNTYAITLKGVDSSGVESPSSNIITATTKWLPIVSQNFNVSNQSSWLADFTAYNYGIGATHSQTITNNQGVLNVTPTVADGSVGTNMVFSTPLDFTGGKKYRISYKEQNKALAVSPDTDQLGFGLTTGTAFNGFIGSPSTVVSGMPNGDRICLVHNAAEVFYFRKTVGDVNTSTRNVATTGFTTSASDLIVSNNNLNDVVVEISTSSIKITINGVTYVNTTDDLSHLNSANVRLIFFLNLNINSNFALNQGIFDDILVERIA